MISELDESIRQLLIAELPVKNGEIDISFNQPKREWSARVSRPTINLFLYDVRENPVLRNHQWEQVTPARPDARNAHLKRSPLRVDCFYMITVWAIEPDDEHHMLSRCLMALFRFPVIPEAHLVGSIKKQPFEIQARLAVHDRLTNPAEVWSALDNEIRPSIPYIVTLALDPWTEVAGPLVRTRSLRVGQSAHPALEQLAEDTANRVTIGGTIWDKSENGTPLPGIQVAIKGTGFFTSSNEQGRFVLGGLLEGEYILVAWPTDGRPLEKRITVPASEGSYDLVIGMEGRR